MNEPCARAARTRPVDRSDDAVARFAAGYNCAQAVLSAYAADLGLNEEASLRIAAPFGGGMGREGEVCGALTGALMALGLTFGPVMPTDSEDKDLRAAISRSVIEAFRERCGAIRCRDLLGAEIQTAEGREHARQLGLFADRCPRFVREAARLVAERP